MSLFVLPYFHSRANQGNERQGGTTGLQGI